ncbi:FAD binding domain-containing protein [Paraburkholderia caballeronis]|uniref:Carbon monoxide dehydrogenase, medium subunit n=1 Tax=Paraburkholderia caballeronis TaxID=416943 RepID=A0A1H7JCU4_9BURK|nr:xanthine dehydrogenase family protein subunit M [Paraburkholderia caballeronis]PXW27477.1 carbon monoxide dehydrogenase medium subunit [Paraburkholderia caballeronis]PXX02951.1 carbon monoxide dehydrogenase medium subunit [Paraburkholderia caballeronis]RAK03676.1 carbon monoxide dehydrogenase medium subunit [Paraburkholderia caballeronis]SEC26547.1 carbon monoxide dehydrogenase, medium subunit [Paraburkholderia caballeronis]SEK72346.1 carbon monoxide dehydrogenase, medium subunit [Paraburkh
MIPRPFEYHAPNTLPEALALLGAHGDAAKLLAGGHSLLPMMKLRFAQPEHLIDLGKLSELKGIRDDGGTLWIGAMTTENELIWSTLLQEKCPLLVEGARQISDPQVRYRGTLGGDLSHGDPGNDHPALAIALDASFVLQGEHGERVLPADGFFVGTYATLMEPGEIMTGIRIPVPPAGTGYCYAKLKRKTGDFATAAAAVTLRIERGSVAHARIALTNVGDAAIHATDAEQALLGKPLDDAAITAAARLAMAACDPVADLRGDPDYKRAMAGEMTRRALRTAYDRAAH